MYITIRQKSHAHQLTWEDILNGIKTGCPWRAEGRVGTVTRIVYTIPANVIEKADIPHLISKFQTFNETYADLYNQERSQLYRTFYIPKRSGGLRRIDAPNEELMNALRNLKNILEIDCGALYHTAAFAYVKNRCCVDAVKKHQANESNWFLKLDFKNFFGSTTPKFLYDMMTMSFPFCEIVKTPEGKDAFVKALDLCFLNGGLPQGTPISPTLTNIMMIPIDHRIFNDLAHKRRVYTRYADDLLISSVQAFDKNDITAYVNDVLKSFHAPFRINEEKTRYGSRKGANWNLGVMLNKDNNITVGHMKKKHFKAALCNFIMDFKNLKRWSAEQTIELVGQLSWFKSVEPDYFNYIIKHMEEKFHVNLDFIIRICRGDALWF